MWVNVHKRLYAVAVNDDREKVITRIVCDFYNKRCLFHVRNWKSIPYLIWLPYR